MPDVLTLLAGLKEVVVTVAAVIGATVALRGLDAWKRQLSGKTKYEVGLRFLRAAYKVRDTIALVRTPFIGSGEVAHARRESERGVSTPTVGNRQGEDMTAAYALRWKPVMEAMSDLQVVVQEAEVLWGQRPRDLVRPLQGSVSELKLAIERYLQGQSGGADDTVNRRHELTLPVVFSGVGDQGADRFSDEVKAAVAAVEDFIRPHLK